MKRTIKLDPILCPMVPTGRSDEGLRCAIALARARNAKADLARAKSPAQMKRDEEKELVAAE